MSPIFATNTTLYFLARQLSFCRMGRSPKEESEQGLMRLKSGVTSGMASRYGAISSREKKASPNIASSGKTTILAPPALRRVSRASSNPSRLFCILTLGE